MSFQAWASWLFGTAAHLADATDKPDDSHTAPLLPGAATNRNSTQRSCAHIILDVLSAPFSSCRRYRSRLTEDFIAFRNINEVA
jgi:hypothetical protein